MLSYGQHDMTNDIDNKVRPLAGQTGLRRTLTMIMLLLLIILSLISATACLVVCVDMLRAANELANASGQDLALSVDA